MGNEAETTGKIGTETTTENQPGNEGGTPVEEGSQGSTQTGGAGGGDSEPDSIDKLPKWAQSMVKDLRNEAANYRTQLRDKEKELEKVGMDDNTRAIEEAKEQAAAEALGKANERIKLSEARSQLAQNNIVNPNDRTLNLLDLSSVEVDENGNVSGLDSAVEALKKDYPGLIKGSNTNPDISNREPEPAKVSMNDVIRAAAGK